MIIGAGHDKAPEPATAGRPAPFDVVAHRSAGDARIHVRGEVDLATVPAVRSALEHAEASDALRIVLDLTDVSFIDSAGIAILLQADARSRSDGGRLRPDPRRLTHDFSGIWSAVTTTLQRDAYFAALAILRYVLPLRRRHDARFLDSRDA